MTPKEELLAKAIQHASHNNFRQAITLIVGAIQIEDPPEAAAEPSVLNGMVAGQTMAMQLSVAKKSVDVLQRRKDAMQTELEVTRRAAINIRAQLRPLENDFSSAVLTDALDMLDAMERSIGRCLKNSAK